MRQLVPSSSSEFPAMLDLQPGDSGEVCSLLQCLDRSPNLPLEIHRTGPCLASQSVKGGAGCGWGFEDLCRMDIRLNGKSSVPEVGEELTVSSSQSTDCDLNCSAQLVDAVLFCPKA